MNRIVKQVIVFAFSVVLLAGCQSKEKRAENLIRSDLSNRISEKEFIFDSYQPIKTLVVVAHRNQFNDSTCWHKSKEIALQMQWTSNCAEAFKNEKDQKQKERMGNLFKEFLQQTQDMTNEVLDSLHALDTTQIVGWEVYHDFTCKTRHGQDYVGHYRYVMSKDFKHVIICEIPESELDRMTRRLLKANK